MAAASESKYAGLDIVLLAVVSITFTTGWSFGWPPIRIMLKHARTFEGVPDEGQLYEALFSFAAAGVDFGGHVAGWMFGIGGPNFCVTVGGLGSAVSMFLSVLATRYADTCNWLLFPALTLQALAGAHFFVGVLNFQNYFPRYGNFVIGAFIYASNAGAVISELQRSFLKSIDSLNPEGVQMMFAAQGCLYIVLTFIVASKYPKKAFTTGRPEAIDHGKCCSLEAWRGIATSIGFWALTLLTCTVGVHAKWVLSEFDSILKDRNGTEAEVQAMTAAFFTWMPLLLLVAYLFAGVFQNVVKGNLNLMLLLACFASLGQAILNALFSFQAQWGSFLFLPVCWQVLYMTATQYTGVLFPRPTDQAHSWGLLIGIQGVAMFTLNGLHAFAEAHGHSLTNLMFAVFALSAVVVIICIELHPRSSRRNWQLRSASHSFATDVETSHCGGLSGRDGLVSGSHSNVEPEIGMQQVHSPAMKHWDRRQLSSNSRASDGTLASSS